MVKRLPAMRETWDRSLGGEDPLEKEMATHASTIAWIIPWTEAPARLQSMGSQRVVDICHYKFVKTRKMYTKSELQSKPWALDDNDVSVWIHPL